MDRKLNVLFVFLLVVIFTASASAIQQWQVILGAALATFFSLAAFLFRKLSLDGMFAAIVVGSCIFGFGGWPAGAVLLLFFISSAAVTSEWKAKKNDLPDSTPRSGLQVWANGLWLVVFFLLLPVFNTSLFLVAALGALATANADTWATEVGTRRANTTYLITDFRTVPAGTDGGLSIQGTTAALFGSALIAAAAIYFFSLQLNIFICIFAAGFLGSVIDSYFGATFQRNNRSVAIPVSESQINIDNNIVNAMATGIGALLAIILKLGIT